jgi:peptidyl-prolyl cis-trans isomerase SurA
MSVGQLSPLIRNASGFHIIKLADMRGGKQVVTQTKARHILLKTNEILSDREAERQLTALKYRLENGENFAALASATSTDLGSAAEGGDLGWVTPGDMVAEFETVMDSLREGQISDPFKSRLWLARDLSRTTPRTRQHRTSSPHRSRSTNSRTQN